jgi:hypothetical protein
MNRPSASSVERVLACPGSAHLEQHDYRSDYAEAGNDRHGDAEAAAVLGAHEDLPWQVRKLLEPGDVMAAECAMAYDVSDDTARALGHIAWRDYSGLRPFEIPMTIDLIVYGENRVLVVDYKGFEDVTSAALNPQLATGALAVARASGRDEVTVAIVYLGASWKPADVATLCVFDLDVHAARLREMMTSTSRELVTGKHCKYCHAFISCPEQRRLAEEAGGGAIAMRVESMIPFGNDEDAADAYDLLQRIKTVQTRLSAALYARAAERPIPLRNGRMFGPHAKLGDREYDGPTVHAVVAAMPELGRDVADKVVEMVASQAQFERVVKPLVKRGQFAATKKAVFGEVERLGKMARKETVTIEEYEPTLHVVAPETDEPKQLTNGSAESSPF